MVWPLPASNGNTAAYKTIDFSVMLLPPRLLVFLDCRRLALWSTCSLPSQICHLLTLTPPWLGAAESCCSEALLGTQGSPTESWPVETEICHVNAFSYTQTVTMFNETSLFGVLHSVSRRYRQQPLALVVGLARLVILIMMIFKLLQFLPSGNRAQWPSRFLFVRQYAKY